MATRLMARLAVVAFGALLSLPMGAAAQETIRIGCPTKTYFPTILATVAKEKGLFEKEGLRPEITIYRGGGETFEAIAANSADLGTCAMRSLLPFLNVSPQSADDCLYQIPAWLRRL